ncbi:hypothetical protein [Marinicellulosiphila megalodicopiae]|uniref:hypothetical protein n=1 Tax=Marinicellulosiphila megalodicopiae TaxID=2724896 RepID=UPI003BB1670A
MNTLIFQIHIEQWDKGQKAPDEVMLGEYKTRCFPIQAKPKFFILNSNCIIDRHSNSDDQSTDAITRKLKTSLLKDGSVMLEQFLVKASDGIIELSYQHKNGQLELIGQLNDGWLQASFTWRKSVEQDNQIFWLYEKVTLNAAFVEEFECDYFLSHGPQKSIQIESE